MTSYPVLAISVQHLFTLMYLIKLSELSICRFKHCLFANIILLKFTKSISENKLE